eukprot:CAMPEP_0115266138 /NCGR_PEP_ID=MMETSP0270-20121206/51310_1 /TAXON_ID=71861 /ORGANISM="Scrippsiella trochoidea, Strain CCMP3099" /LENGTH=84 /DNA_ID=CAMNT_0002682219 /DNA_START=200 /DNA_END=455 /DNA_ORIENTATION=+
MAKPHNRRTNSARDRAMREAPVAVFWRVCKEIRPNIGAQHRILEQEEEDELSFGAKARLGSGVASSAGASIVDDDTSVPSKPLT